MRHRLRTLLGSVFAGTGHQDDGALHRIGPRLRGHLQLRRSTHVARVKVRWETLRVVRGDLPGVRRRMRQTQNGALPEVRGSLSQVR